MIWGFANATLSTNLARDLGTRMVAAIFYGGDAFNRYSPIAIFANIPATLMAVGIYELILKDSFQAIAHGHVVSSFKLTSCSHFSLRILIWFPHS
jgi:hypothetical protein